MFQIKFALSGETTAARAVPYGDRAAFYATVSPFLESITGEGEEARQGVIKSKLSTTAASRVASSPALPRLMTLRSVEHVNRGVRRDAT